MMHTTEARLAPVIGACAVMLLLPQRSFAQQDPWDYRDPALSRGQLQQVLARYQAAATSPAYSAALRAQAALEADSIRTRLATGDIRPGDRVRIRVEGQAALNDTFPVLSDQALQLPAVGRVPLAGALRSELRDSIAQYVNRVFRGIPVQVELLTRVAVLGGVARPGFYALPPEALVEDAIGLAGGLGADGRLVAVYIERGSDRIWQTDSLQTAMRQRRTIAQLGLESGDRIVVPIVPARDTERTMRTMTYLIGLPLSLYTIIQLF